MRREIAVLTNPAAGRGRAARVRDAALPRLHGAGWRTRELQGRDADEAGDLARDALARGADALVVCGGDGLVNIGLQAVAGTDVPLGLLPAGTGNDVARYLGLPRDDTPAAVQRLLAWRPRPMDLARCGDRYFATVLAAGFDAVVNERANAMPWPRGQMRYNLATLAELRTFRPRSYLIDVDGEVSRLDAVLVAVGNGPSYGGGLRIAHGAVIDDGLLDVVVMGPVSRPDLLRTYPQLFSGGHVHHPAFRRIRGRTVTVAAPGVVGYADGERWGPLPLTVHSVPDAVQVLA
ncbi:hypothetical protein KUV85_05095 [Nocardioides panacisoli]|uniref:diacylglycerol/lipid kinase family protein n=1 Tax=Nocardioides panacisoli TaxID=627624 RepID=UPI001C632BEB|nr:diacylglycerol kinase family protein [Nocardioides panacisoli]QYJ05063.1 hypothetical protein KUV85_05095 [Nocardioides panacisoli]